MEIKEIGAWNVQANSEIFFDQIFKHYAVRTGNTVEVKPLGLTASFAITLDSSMKEIYQQPFLQMRINVPRSLICVLLENNEFVRLI
jgi:hypothetical protein